MVLIFITMVLILLQDTQAFTIIINIVLIYSDLYFFDSFV